MPNVKMTDQPAAVFWEEHYVTRKTGSNGIPGKVMVRFAGPLKAGRALDLGCGHGDDALWLARRGWEVTGADVSETALGRARAKAEIDGLADRTRFERHDLPETFPAGQYDLVTALYLHSTDDFRRTDVLRRAAQAVAPGGLLLIVAHQTFPPWAWDRPDIPPATPDEAFADLQLETQDWLREFVDSVERTARGPDDEEAFVRDTVLALTRR